MPAFLSSKPPIIVGFKHPLVIQAIMLIVVAMVTSYLTIAQASMPRKDAVDLINQSEQRSHEQIEKMNDKQDKILEKLNEMQIDIAVIKQKVGK